MTDPEEADAFIQAALEIASADVPEAERRAALEQLAEQVEGQSGEPAEGTLDETE